MKTAPLRIAIYGKGGVGKSVVATGLSVVLAKRGRSVLHVGCDPKHDSAVRLLPPGARLRTVMEVLGDAPGGATQERIVHEGRLGIHCCESGGPQPGLGCGGRGVARMLEYMEETGLLEPGRYDAVVFDVLGDVVCGGFAAPLRLGFADRVVIVTSEEPMALYAANNISRAVTAYHDNGVVLAGLVANLRGPDARRDKIREFAKRLSTRVLVTIPRDPKILESERRRRTVVEHAPGGPSARAFGTLAAAIEKLEKRRCVLPTPMEDEEFYRFIDSW
ncbi:MAG: ArsA-related P-loop ATPase [Myxococcota bacterium]|nr:ArsA-related P-loop ATPase [Myxococcota bacterium]